MTRDKKGSLWKVVARGTEDTPFQTIGTDKPETLVYAEPFSPITMITERSIERFQKDNKEISLNLTIYGSAKELVSDLRRISGSKSEVVMSKNNTTRPQEAKYTILDDRERTVAYGSFRYG